MELEHLTAAELLAVHTKITETLTRRGVVRSWNTPTGDYAEYLFASAFGWKLTSNSNAAFDAIDRQGSRFQIKARRITRTERTSRQLSALRRLEDENFDCLAVVLFEADYRVNRALILPRSIIPQIAKFSAHVNGWIIRLKEAHWQLPNARDVTGELKVAAQGV